MPVEVRVEERKKTTARTADLRGRPGVVHRSSAGYHLHDEHPEAVHVAPLVQHPGPRVLRRHVPAGNATRRIAKLQQST